MYSEDKTAVQIMTYNYYMYVIFASQMSDFRLL
jgi:hypothetical protein